MKYDDFCKYLERELPLNRKERFYTGTVLPSLLFHKGLSIFYDFLKSLRGFPKEINETNTGDNFLFYTEYNLKESAGSRNVGEKIETATKDTPDCIIEFLTPVKLFVVVEAKMFSKASQADLKRQMSAQQKAVISVLKSKYKLTDQQILHIALVPKALGITECSDYQVVYWDFFIEIFSKLQDNMFFNYLRFALDNYDKLVQGKKWVKPSYVEDYLSGEEIYRKFKQGENLWIGRQGGTKIFLEDIQTGKWRKHKYYISSQKPERGKTGQWINSNEFIKMIDTVQKGGTGKLKHVEGYLSGEEVYRKFEQGEILWIGRRGGKKTFLADIQTDKWRNRQYCFSSRKPDRGMPGQWINSNEFIKMIDTVAHGNLNHQ
jgi:hypothetical protein